MMDRERAIRRFRDAKQAGQQLAQATRTNDLQDAWEKWTIAWRIAVDMLEGYGRRNGAINAALKELQKHRSSDDGLIYVWECGNAERHNPDGSAQASRGLALNAADPSKHLYIKSLVIEHGRVAHLSGSNMSLNNDVGSLELRPIPVRGKATVVPPTGANERSLLNACENYLNRLKSLVVPKF
ncbi:hypothetical protein [Brevundimonas naejangsanensis]|uniref:hypothetical protein n=1 Tax=Brevundimonas naejangsanensis TaxID=588932 RepID=UPI003D0642CD